MSTGAAGSGMFCLLILVCLLDCCNTTTTTNNNVGLSGAALLVRNKNQVKRKDGKSKYVVDCSER